MALSPKSGKYNPDRGPSKKREFGQSSIQGKKSAGKLRYGAPADSCGYSPKYPQGDNGYGADDGNQLTESSGGHEPSER